MQRIRDRVHAAELISDEIPPTDVENAHLPVAVGIVESPKDAVQRHRTVARRPVPGIYRRTAVPIIGPRANGVLAQQNVIRPLYVGVVTGVRDCSASGAGPFARLPCAVTPEGWIESVTCDEQTGRVEVQVHGTGCQAPCRRLRTRNETLDYRTGELGVDAIDIRIAHAAIPVIKRPEGGARFIRVTIVSVRERGIANFLPALVATVVIVVLPILGPVHTTVGR